MTGDWRSARDEWLLDLADDQVDRDEWAELHGYGRTHPTLAETVHEAGLAKARAMSGIAGIIEEEMQ